MKDTCNLTINLGRIKLKNPVLVASGTFGYGEEYSQLIDLNKLGGIITKSITLEPREGNPPPRLIETPAGLLNSIGLVNPGLKVFCKTNIPFLKQFNTRIIVSIAGEREEDYLYLTEKLNPVQGIDGLEVNVSCPNVQEGLTSAKKIKEEFRHSSYSKDYP